MYEEELIINETCTHLEVPPLLVAGNASALKPFALHVDCNLPPDGFLLHRLVIEFLKVFLNTVNEGQNLLPAPAVIHEVCGCKKKGICLIYLLFFCTTEGTAQW